MAVFFAALPRLTGGCFIYNYRVKNGEKPIDR